jgi:tetratricopeptide (TPR) repeat protein
VGQYLDAVEANALSVAADDAYFATAGTQGIYHFYRAHNHHFLIWAAMFMGARGQALTAARDMVSKLPMDNLDEMPQSVEQFLFAPIHVMMRFGLWEEILAEPAFAESFPLAVTLWHHARAVAYANTGRLAEAADEAVAFEEAALTIPAASTARRGNSSTLVEIARNMMFGEILFKQGRYEESFAALRQAVAAEDTLPYSEPPGWMQPMRHALGALLLEAGEVLEAEAVYRADLAQHAENGWSLHGLAESLRRMGRFEEAADVQRRFEVSWAHADVLIQSSCFCRVSG